MPTAPLGKQRLGTTERVGQEDEGTDSLQQQLPRSGASVELRRAARQLLLLGRPTGRELARCRQQPAARRPVTLAQAARDARLRQVSNRTTYYSRTLAYHWASASLLPDWKGGSASGATRRTVSSKTFSIHLRQKHDHQGMRQRDRDEVPQLQTWS